MTRSRSFLSNAVPDLPHGHLIGALFLLLCATPFVAAQPPPPPPPPQLPPVPVPPQNPITEGKRVLGKILFWDEQLSSDNTVACGTCHRPERGGTDPRTAINPGLNGTFGNPDDVAGSAGIVSTDSNRDYLPDPVFGLGVQVTGRRAPDFTGGAYHQRVFWDGRSGPAFTDPDTSLVTIPQGGALEAQSLNPILGDAEMAHTGRTFAQATAKLQNARPLKLATNLPPDVAQALAGGTTYPELFLAAFGTPAITAQRIAFALATYERTLVPNQTPFDVWASGQPNPLTPNQMQGFNIFNTVGRCNACHQGPNFSDGTFRNIGLRPIAEDIGRQGVTNNPADRGRFKVPSLRNAALRQRFFHNGQSASLTNAVEEYNNSGGPFPDNRDPVLQGLVFSPLQRDLMVQFLQALTDPRAASGAFPFDRPTLRSETVAPFSNRYGPATAGPLGIIPTIVCNVPAAIGTEFKVGLGGAAGGGVAWLGISTAAALPPIASGSVQLNVDPAGLAIFETLPLPGAGPGAGFATYKIGVPPVPALAGIDVFAQWLVFDPVSGNFSATRGAAYEIF